MFAFCVVTGNDEHTKPAIMEIILWEFLMFPNFPSPKVKQSAIVSNKQGVYELQNELPNDMRLRIFGNKEKSGKSQNLLE